MRYEVMIDEGILVTNTYLQVALVAPQKFWPFSVLVRESTLPLDFRFNRLTTGTLQLMKRQEEFFAIPTSKLTPLQIREQLSNVAAESGLDDGELKAFKDALELKPNGGTGVTDALKYTGKYPLSSIYIV